MTISCSTKVCSFGKQVVEKVENEHGQYESGRYVYRFENSPMCDYMILFINQLKQLPEKTLQNNVLENFSILQVGLFCSGLHFIRYDQILTIFYRVGG